MAGLLTYSFVTAAFPTTLFRLVSGLVAGLSGRKSQQPVCRRIALRSLFNERLRKKIQASVTYYIAKLRKIEETAKKNNKSCAGDGIYLR